MPDFEEDEYDRRPRRRPQRRSYDDDAYEDYDDYSAYENPPEARVKGPAIAMMAVGLLHVVLMVVLAVVFVVLFVTENQQPQPVGGDDPVLFLLAAIGFVLCTVYFGFIAYGGWLMSRCRSYKMAMTAAIMSIASIVCIGLSSVLIMPFGIWALVVLNDERVKQAFRGPLLERRRSDDEDWDDR